MRLWGVPAKSLSQRKSCFSTERNKMLTNGHFGLIIKIASVSNYAFLYVFDALLLIFGSKRMEYSEGKECGAV